jgi:hypothetical protein
MTAFNPKRRSVEGERERPVPPINSTLPTRPPVRWASGEGEVGDGWHADWDDAELDGEAVLSELPEEVVSALPEEVTDEDPDAWDRAQEAGEAEEAVVPAAEVIEDDGEAEGDEKSRGRRRSKTIARKQMLRERRRMLAQGTIPEIVDYDRPVRRSECREDKRPCLYVSCRYHLYLDVNPMTGSIKLNFPDKEVWELAETCALDVAERGGITLEEVGEIMNLTRERIRQVEVSGLEKLKTGEVPLHTFIDGRELEPRIPVGSKSLPVVDD